MPVSSEWCYLDVDTGGKALDTGALSIGTRAFRVLNVCIYKQSTLSRTSPN